MNLEFRERGAKIIIKGVSPRCASESGARVSAKSGRTNNNRCRPKPVPIITIGGRHKLVFYSYYTYM